jgi:phosphomannomutase
MEVATVLLIYRPIQFLLWNREWVAFRASGTEPLIRCYIEAKSKANLKKLDAACRQLLA